MAKRNAKATEDVTHTVEQETAVTDDAQATQEPATAQPAQGQVDDDAAAAPQVAPPLDQQAAASAETEEERQRRMTQTPPDTGPQATQGTDLAAAEAARRAGQEPQPNSTQEVQRAANAPLDQNEVQAARAHEEATTTGYRPDVQPVTNEPVAATSTEEQLFHRINTLDARLRQVESRIAADTPVTNPGPAPTAISTEGDTATDTTRQ